MTHHVVPLVPLTSNQKLHFNIRNIYKNATCFHVNRRTKGKRDVSVSPYRLSTFSSLFKLHPRILVTHAVTYLPKTDHIIVMKDGRISEQGSYQELVERKGDFAAFLIEHMTEADNGDMGDLEVVLEETMGKDEFKKELNRQISKKESIEHQTSFQSNGDANSAKDKDGSKGAVQNGTSADVKGAKLIAKEQAQTGSVGFSVYLHYLKSVGTAGSLTAISTQGWGKKLKFVNI